jgi:hypothetical protein
MAKSTLAGMSELWLPGGVLDIDDFVRRVHQQV